MTLPGYYNTRERLGLIDYDSIIDDYRSRVIKNNETEKLSKSVDEDGTREDTIVKLPQIQKTAKVRYDVQWTWLSQGSSTNDEGFIFETTSFSMNPYTCKIMMPIFRK